MSPNLTCVQADGVEHAQESSDHRSIDRLSAPVPLHRSQQAHDQLALYLCIQGWAHISFSKRSSPMDGCVDGCMDGCMDMQIGDCVT